MDYLKLNETEMAILQVLLDGRGRSRKEIMQDVYALSQKQLKFSHVYYHKMMQQLKIKGFILEYNKIPVMYQVKGTIKQDLEIMFHYMNKVKKEVEK